MAKGKRKRQQRAGWKECQQCKCEKPDTDFFPERKGVKIRFCFECARTNMRIWWMTRNVGKSPDSVIPLDEA